MESTITIIEFVIIITIILFAAAMILAVANRVKIPFTIALVVLGALIAHIYPYGPTRIIELLEFNISPDLIFYVCLPTLIFESAYNLNAKNLRQNIVAVLTLAIPGLLLSTVLIGVIISFLVGIDLLPALLLGAILSATDPVAVISIFKKLGAPKQLTVLIEGESLFNDATSIVTAKIIFAIILTGAFTYHHIWHGVYDFLFEFIGGIFVGAGSAIIIGYFLNKVENNREIEISLTAILAYATFLLAQDLFHVSGVTAVVTAGLVMSTWGYTKISPEVTGFMHRFWDFLAYFANAIIFLLVGFSVNLFDLFNNFGAIIAVIIAMLISRAIIIFGLVPIIKKIPNQPNIDYRYQSVMYWGGLRGAIALGIVLSLEKFEYTALFNVLVLGAVIFTLLVQGLSIEKLVKFLGLTMPTLAEQLSRLESKLQTKQKAFKKVKLLQQQGMFSKVISDNIANHYLTKIEKINKDIQLLKKVKVTENDELTFLYFNCFALERKLYYKLFAEGHLVDKTYKHLIDKIENRTEIVKAGKNAINNIKIFSARKYWYKRLLYILYKMPFLNILVQNINISTIAFRYSVAWGQYQGIIAVLQYLDELILTDIKKQEVVAQIQHYYGYMLEMVKRRLDLTAKQFPEYVLKMQARLAERIILQTEIAGLSQQAQKGIITDNLAESLQVDINKRLRELRENVIHYIPIQDQSVLQRNRLLVNLPAEEFDIIKALLKVKVFPADEIIVESGTTTKPLYLIVQGVIRLEGKNTKTPLASLFATDYFGLHVEIIDQHDPIVFNTATPSVLAEIDVNTLNKIKTQCPQFSQRLSKIIDR